MANFTGTIQQNRLNRKTIKVVREIERACLILAVSSHFLVLKQIKRERYVPLDLLYQELLGHQMTAPEAENERI